jgi:branched-chain amino acid transport system permease protein
VDDGLAAAMNLDIFLVLLQDGLTNGAIYALIAISLVLVFAVTRVIFIPQGEFVAYGVLTAAAIERGVFPPTALLLLGLGVAAALRATLAEWRYLTRRAWIVLIGETIVLPLILIAILRLMAGQKQGIVISAVLTLSLITLMGPIIYRLAFHPLENRSTLTLLIAAVGVHLAMVGLGLVIFGAEGARLTAISGQMTTLGAIIVTGQSVVVLATAAILSFLLYLGINHTLIGQALMATAINRLGAKLSGISPSLCGRIAFALAAFIGALSGLLIGPMTTVYYDSGFVIGLKGFVAAIFGGLISFPIAAASAFGIGIIESMASFTASNLKEAIVFLSIIPVLLLRSLMQSRPHEEDE